MKAWGAGIATYSGDKILEVFYPEPRLDGTPEDPLAFADTPDELRGVTQKAVLTVIDDLDAPPADTADAYLRLHLLSHRLVKPRRINLDGIFGALPNVAWTSLGPVDPANLTNVLLDARRRNIAVTAPYLHDGSLTSLDAVVDRYKTSITADEKRDLIAFLGALTDEELLTDPRLADPRVTSRRSGAPARARPSPATRRSSASGR